MQESSLSPEEDFISPPPQPLELASTVLGSRPVSRVHPKPRVSRLLPPSTISCFKPVNSPPDPKPSLQQSTIHCSSMYDDHLTKLSIVLLVVLLYHFQMFLLKGKRVHQFRVRH